MSDGRHRVIANGIETNYVDVNKEVPQGTVLGPFLFFNDKRSNSERPDNLSVKFADDMTRERRLLLCIS